MKLYFKIFLATGVPFGIIMGCYFGSTSSMDLGIYLGIMSGLFFGLVVSACLGTLHKIKTKGMSSVEGDDVGPNQTLTVTIDDSIDVAFEKCERAVGTVLHGNVTEIDRESGTITAATSMSWTSFGEKIRVVLSADEGGRTRVTVSSAPKLKMTLLDYGKGRQNVESVVNFITSELEVVKSYFQRLVTDEGVIMECKKNPLITVQACLVQTEVSSPLEIGTVIEPTLLFPNDPDGYHEHYESVDQLLEALKKILAETLVYEVSDGDRISGSIDFSDINDLEYYKRTFNEPESAVHHENHLYIREAKIISWLGTKDGTLNADNLDEQFNP
jgi:hypothetical protein